MSGPFGRFIAVLNVFFDLKTSQTKKTFRPNGGATLRLLTISGTILQQPVPPAGLGDVKTAFGGTGAPGRAR